MNLKDIKNDLVSEAELLIYQMRLAKQKTDYETINLKADSLNNVCKKLELIRQEEERLHNQFNL